LAPFLLKMTNGPIFLRHPIGLSSVNVRNVIQLKLTLFYIDAFQRKTDGESNTSWLCQHEGFAQQYAATRRSETTECRKKGRRSVAVSGCQLAAFAQRTPCIVTVSDYLRLTVHVTEVLLNRE